MDDDLAIYKVGMFKEGYAIVVSHEKDQQAIYRVPITEKVHILHLLLQKYTMRDAATIPKRGDYLNPKSPFVVSKEATFSNLQLAVRKG